MVHYTKDAKASSKKYPIPKKGPREIMLSPYEEIRPYCTNVAEMEEIMQRLLAPAKRRSNRIPWFEFKNMNEMERKQEKEELKMKDVNKGLRGQLVCGMNELMSAIEKHSLSSAVMCEDIVPAFMMNFLIDFSTVHHVPIIILPNLRKITLETLGFSCSCLGIKRNASDNETAHFYPMHKKIVEIAKEYGLPEKTNLCQCPWKEPMELHEHLTTSSDQKLHRLGTEGLDGHTILEANSAWPCMRSKPMGYWKRKRQKLRKEECQHQVKQTGVESEGKESSVLIGNELLESDKGKKRSEILPDTASKSKGSKYHASRRRPETHPYLRTFLTYLDSVRVRKPAESVDGDDYEKHAKKRERSWDSVDGEEVSEVGSEEEQSTNVEKSGDFKYVIRSGKKRMLSMFHPYKPLKLIEVERD